MNAYWVLLWITLAAPAGRADTLHLKNGRKAECKVLTFSTDKVRITFQNADRDVPLADIEYVSFPPLPGEEAALAAAVKAGEAAPLLEIWAKKFVLLGRPRSNAGEIGLVYAELLSRTPTADRLDRALKVYQQIESTDWSAERKGRAKAGRLRVLLRQGRVEAVKPEAERLAQEAADPRVLIELRHVLAETAAAELRKLEDEHPRWEQEDDIKPAHDRLFHEALEGYSFPHVFHGAEEDLAARGLWAAALLHQKAGDAESAVNAAVDLAKLYPGTAEANAASELAKQLKPPPAKKSRPSAEEGADVEEEPEHEP